MNLRAIASGAGLLLMLAVVMGLLIHAWGVDQTSGPRLLTLTSLWLIAGFHAGRCSSDAGLLHGMLAGLLGGGLLIPLVMLLQPVPELLNAGSQPSLQKSYFLVLATAGLWGSIGGLFADIARALRARRAQRNSATANTNTTGDR